MILSREQILAADDRRIEEVDVPEWGGTVRVSTMSGAQRDAFEASLLSDGKPDTSNAHAKLAAVCIVGEDGSALFTAHDLEALGRKSSSALSAVVKVARRLNKMGDEGLEAARGN